MSGFIHLHFSLDDSSVPVGTCISLVFLFCIPLIINYSWLMGIWGCFFVEVY
jgi:hypothetical protein